MTGIPRRRMDGQGTSRVSAPGQRKPAPLAVADTSMSTPARSARGVVIAGFSAADGAARIPQRGIGQYTRNPVSLAGFPRHFAARRADKRQSAHVAS
jgi:hypothetical protein